ncbi:hypothetical protein [Halalkalicoccus jeotgali]|uniref:DUF8056 domain-containing protein n=1 Tax=Halalkalicoccus jeotgali (strain DSM 18796 / CECT 7217 / JCM 14584 / KCTC 4019 / B3) TaxID=795797 RepID=D8J8X7_HALJB|nr:hypothetical protein [Halalkalicoccus jeotgali]ADJ14312.1 hypothetical protein HacjB3_04605 [Halalkalicoccus jeotgali B3]ELY40575.1 hypothetical protein C497_02972 [Halalkalicoccus jeotgali B3]
MGDDRTYKGLLGSFRYSYGQSDSPVYRGYVALAAVLSGLVALLFALALIVVIATTLGATESITLVRSFFVLVALLVVAPILAPVLLVARRHRKRLGSGSAYDTALALGGFLFVGALYLGLVISVPPGLQESTGSFGIVIDPLYALPSPLGIVPPLLAAALIAALHRRLR